MAISFSPPGRQNPFFLMSQRSWNRVLEFLSPAERGRFAQACKWTAYNFSPLRCMLGEKCDPQRTRRWSDVIEMQLEHPLNTSAQRAGAALFISAAKGDELFVRKLLSTRPDIRPLDKERALSIASIYRRHPIVREILIHRYPTLGVHEIVEMLFPPQKQHATLPNRPAIFPIYAELQKIAEMEAVEASLGPSEVFDLRSLILHFFAENHYLTRNWNFDFTLNILSTVHPLFAKAWEMANRHQRVVVKEVRKDESVVQSNIHAKGDYASYHCDTHQIEVAPEATPAYKVELLFLETMNAMQRELFGAIFNLAGEGELDREEYASLIELVEYRSEAWKNKMLNYMKERPKSFSCFREAWVHVNQPHFPGEISHADHYRHIWDNAFFGRFLHKHRGLIFPEALQTPSSLLYQAASEGDVSEITVLWRKYPDLDEWDAVGVALSAAAANGHLEAVCRIIRLWKDVSTQSVGIALCNASTGRHWHVVRHLLKRPGFNFVDLRYVLGKADETGDLALMHDLRKILADEQLEFMDDCRS